MKNVNDEDVKDHEDVQAVKIIKNNVYLEGCNIAKINGYA